MIGGSSKGSRAVAHARRLTGTLWDAKMREAPWSAAA